MPLYMRLDSSGYRFVRPIPADLQPYFSKKNFVWRLGRNYKEAKSACAEHTLFTERALASAREKAAGGQGLEAFLRQDRWTRNKRLTFTDQLPGQLASLWLQGLEADANARAQGLSEDEYEAREASIQEVLPRVNKALATGDLQEFGPMVAGMLVMRGYELNAPPDQWQALCYGFLRLIKPGLDVMKARNNGEHLGSLDTSSLPAPLAAAWEPVPLLATESAGRKRLSDVTSEYERHLRSSERKARTTRLSIWARFVAFTNDKPLADVHSSDLYDFLEHRLNATAPEKPWSQAYVSGRVINTIRAAFSLAKTKNLISSDPALDLTVLPRISAKAELERKKPRFPYKTEQLNKVFSSDWYDPRSTSWKGRMRDDLGARYWIPLLCMWHGFRVREACQMALEDVDVKDATIVIRSDYEEPLVGPRRSVKTGASSREVPVHPELIRLGFLDFVKRADALYRSGPLFPCAFPDPNSESPKWGRAYEQAYLRLARDNLGFGKGYGSHSFRHSLEDRIRAAKALHHWPSGISSAYTGRAQNRSKEHDAEGSEKDYGNGYEADALRPFISQIGYPGVVLPPPFPIWIEDLPIASNALVTVASEWQSRLQGRGDKATLMP